MTTYYVSMNGCDNNDGLSPNTPWKTIKKVNASIIGGDVVNFRCGDVFYGQILPPTQNNTSAPTVYTSYGDGAKPIISQYKTALPGVWEDCKNGVWRLDLLDTAKFTGNVTELNSNVGFLKIDGIIKAKKCFELNKLEDLWDFWNDKQYLYIKSNADPSSIAKDIKIACNIICMHFADDIQVEGLVFIGTGAHGISGTVNRATIRNCEFHDIGGSELLSYHEPCVRYGNGVECWTDSSEVLVEGCRFSGIYDVAITMQGGEVTSGWVNMTFRNNVIWNCQQSFEVWSSGNLPNTGFQNCVFENNVCIASGYCWGYDVRPIKEVSCHLLIYRIGCPLCDIVIRNNTFYRARITPIYKSGGPDKIPEDYRIIGNTFFIDPDQDLAFHRNSDSEGYKAFFEKLSKENQIITSTF